MTRRAVCSVLWCALIIGGRGWPEAPLLEPLPGNLEGEWRFTTDPAGRGEGQGYAAADLDDSAWRTLAVPGYWEAQGVTEGEAVPVPGVQYTAYDGTAWYRLRFTVPGDWAREPMVLHIGGIDDFDRTYVNGQLVGETGRDVVNPSTRARNYPVPPDLISYGDENVIAIEVTDGGGPGGIHLGPVTLLAENAIERMAGLMQTDNLPLEDRFRTPPASRRILQIVHSLPKDESAHEAFLLNLIGRGFGGIVTNVHFDDYLKSEDNWRSFEHGVRMAKGLGMALWLYDEQGYPSGTAGGQVLEGHPEWRAHGLLVARAETSGEPVSIELPEGDLILATACRRAGAGVTLDGAVDLSASVVERRLAWNPEPGVWSVFAFVDNPIYEGTHATANVFKYQPYINIMDPAPVRRFIEMTHQEYARRLPDLAELFVSTFTDEPSLMSVFIQPQPLPVLPWVHDLPETFAAAKGYALTPLLPALVADAGSVGHRARCDFWDHVGQRVADAFFGQIQDWCHQAKIPSGGHLIWEEDLAGHCGFYGDFYRCAERLDYPSIDCLTSVPAQVPWHIAKLLGSIAHLHGAPQVMSETSDHVQRYRPKGDERPVVNVTPDEIRGTCNRLYVAGVNTTTSYYSWLGITTEDQREINEYVGRLGVMLTGGEAVADIAVVYPVETVWAEMTPANQGTTSSSAVREIDRIYREAQNRLFGAQRDFEVINTAAISAGAAADGVLRCGPLAFRAIVLPAMHTIPVSAWAQIDRFARSGGIVIAVADVPRNSMAARDDEEILEVSRGLFGMEDIAELASSTDIRAHAVGAGAAVFVPRGMEPTLPAALARLLRPDVAVDAAPSPLRYAHRRLDGREVYFIINDSAEPATARVRFAAKGGGAVWDPHTGVQTPSTAVEDGGMSSVNLSVRGYGSAFVTFDQASPRERLRVGAELTAGVRLVPLSERQAGPVEWSVGGPAHVRHTFQSGVEVAGVAGCADLDATIDQGGIDSFCFANRKTPGLDLSDVAGWRLRTYVPEGQSASTPILVMLHEEGGGVFFSAATRDLATPGWKESTVWLDSFTLGPWSEDGNGRLDPAKVTSISVGWGGYFGRDAERVEFAFREPELLLLDINR